MPTMHSPRKRGYRHHVDAHTLHDRFFEHVQIDDNGAWLWHENWWIWTEQGCWLWKGPRTANGYGDFKLGSTDPFRISAHKYAYELVFGWVPPGKHLDHLCRIRHCCNPWHLELVSPRVNFLRSHHPVAQWYRTGMCQRGHAMDENNTYLHAKTGKKQCRVCHRIRKRLEAGLSLQDALTKPRRQRKFSPEDIRAIRALEGTMTQRAIGKRYNACQSDIGDILRRDVYADVL
jgi:hypothetical protein